jgi:signal transduction histidine kinase
MRNSSQPRDTLQLHRAVQQLSCLGESSRKSNAALDIKALLIDTVNTAAEVLDCEAASILLYDERRDSLFLAAATGAGAIDPAQYPVSLETSIAGTIYSENRPLIVNDLEAYPWQVEIVEQQLHLQPHNIAGVPLRVRQHVTGVLKVFNKRQGAFDDFDVEVLSLLASQSSLAIDNAHLVQSFQRARQQVNQVDKLKQDFMAIASHELRSPLSVIIGYAEYLKEDSQSLTPEHVNALLSAAYRLQSMVDQMTNMNLMQVGSVKLDLHPTTIKTVLQAVYRYVKPQAEARNHKIVIYLPTEFLLINADVPKLATAFRNLLENAIRFTPRGGTISVKVMARQDEVRIHIIDSGIGIPGNELENIFKEFYQIEDHLTRRNVGLGLGLPIARGLIQLHGGRIWAESAGPGKGSTFKVVLPRLYA